MFDVHLFQQTLNSPSGAKNNLALMPLTSRTVNMLLPLSGKTLS